jgi:alpha-tubulin suppressor-like RCC1 family protein
LKGKNITVVECGGAHTLVKTINSEIYSFGLNDKGQLGLGVVGNFSSIPHKISRFTSFPIIKMACSEESSGLLTSNGDLYVWGRNTEGMFDGEGGMFAMD